MNSKEISDFVTNNLAADFVMLPGNPNGATWENDLLLAIGPERTGSSDPGKSFSGPGQLPNDKDEEWKFGYIAYDYKNELEALHAPPPASIQVYPSYFFKPAFLLKEKNGMIETLRNEWHVPESFLTSICNRISGKAPAGSESFKSMLLRARHSRNSYLKQVKLIQDHLRAGDIYELNFCMEFFAEDVKLDPLELFTRLRIKANAPFSAFCRFGHVYIISSSPERYLRKTGSALFSQPIKGTRRRGINKLEDERLKKELLQDEKERAENVMIVDLVRNDLSRVAQKGSVKVDELFGIYTFEQVHQMISTVSCTLKRDVTFEEIIRSTFPMGSMTGAPKISAMKLIDRYEHSSRGLYSGALGYLTPEGDFDFSVVIRTILYDAAKQYLSFSVGSAITVLSDPEREYEECLVKARALIEVLNGKLSG